MAYNRTTWQDSPSTSTPINAANLNNIEAGLTTVDTAVTNLVTKPLGTVSSNYIIGTADAGKILKITGTATITIPTNGSVAFPVGQSINFIQTVSSTTVFAAGSSSITLRGTPFTNMIGINQQASVVKIDTDDWVLSGNLNERTWTLLTGAGVRGWYGIAASTTGQYLAAVDNSPGIVYTSSNYGTTWTGQTASGTKSWQAVATSSNGQYVTALDSYGYLYVSSNYGTAWATKLNTSPRSWQNVAISSTGQYQVATAYNDYIFTSADYGVNWGTMTASGSRAWRGVAISSTGQKIAAVDQTPGYVSTSTNYGTAWTQQTGSGSRQWYNIASSSDGTKLFACTVGDYVYYSSDSGATWNPLSQLSVGNRYAISCSSDGTKIAVGGADINSNSDYVWTSSDTGSTWTARIGSGKNASRYALVYTPDGTKIYTRDAVGYVQQSLDNI